jgi:hypothetical protein
VKTSNLDSPTCVGRPSTDPGPVRAAPGAVPSILRHLLRAAALGVVAFALQACGGGDSEVPQRATALQTFGPEGPSSTPGAPTPDAFQACLDKMKTTPDPNDPTRRRSIWDIIQEGGGGIPGPGSDGCFMREQIVARFVEQYCPDLAPHYRQVFIVFRCQPPEFEGPRWNFHTVPACEARDGKLYVCETNGDKPKVCSLDKWGYCARSPWVGPVDRTDGQPNIGDRPPVGQPNRVEVCDIDDYGKEPLKEACRREVGWTECVKGAVEACKIQLPGTPTNSNGFGTCVRAEILRRGCYDNLFPK